MKATVHSCEWKSRKHGFAVFDEYEVELSEETMLEELQKLVGGLIELVVMDDGTELIVNEEGIMLDLPLNKWALANNLILGGTVVKLHGKLP
jgi:hypothetical protein